MRPRPQFGLLPTRYLTSLSLLVRTAITRTGPQPGRSATTLLVSRGARDFRRTLLGFARRGQSWGLNFFPLRLRFRLALIRLTHCQSAFRRNRITGQDR